MWYELAGLLLPGSTVTGAHNCSIVAIYIFVITCTYSIKVK